MPVAVARGITLHRTIDAFTDRHPLAAEARDLIGPQRRRLASVIVDIAFDFTLAQAWGAHCSTGLPEFIRDGYSRIEFGARDISEHAARLVPRMRQRRWLESYCTVEGMALTFERISGRSEAVSGLRGAEEDVVACLPELQRLFDAFYPLLLTEVESSVRRFAE